MPALMQRWRPLHITILSLGTMASSVICLAWNAAAVAADPPPLCPSQATAPQAKAPPSDSVTIPKERKPQAKDAAIDIQSDQLTSDIEGNATLKGNVVVRQGDRQIKGEEIQYNSKTNGFKTDSSLQYEDPVLKITGNGGEYSPSQGADFRSATFELRQRAARGSADALKLTPQGEVDLKGVRFTTCPPNDESWQIHAKSITLDSANRIGEARSATVDFEGVPILYLPWLSFPLSSERKSGFLYPSIGNNSRSGVSLSVPYYWNIAPNADLTFEPIEYSKRGADLGGETRFLSSNDHATLRWNFLPYDNVFNSERNHVQLMNTLDLPGQYRFSVAAEDVSDTHYFEDFAQGPEGTSTAFLPQRAALTYRDEHWNLDGEFEHYRTTDYTLAQYNRPYSHLPRLALSGDFGWGETEQVRYGFDSEIVNFHRSVAPFEVVNNQQLNNQLLDVCSAAALAQLGIAGQLSPCINGWRMDVMPQASLNFEAPGYFVRPGIAWRATQYELDNTLPGENRSPSRTLPIASFDTGLIFERQAGSHDQRTVTLEPRMMYLYVPYRNQDDLPLFDTGLPDLDPVELYRNNRYVGADRMSDANQVSLGVTSRLLDAHNGKQFLTATLGEIYYFTNPRVVLPPQLVGGQLEQTEAPRTDHRSDFVAQVALTAFEDWSANVGLQWNPQTSQAERSEVNLQYKPADQSVINVGYRYQHDVLQQAEVSTAWPVVDSWNIFLRGIYSIQDHKPLERFGGFEYRSCCWRVRAGVRSFVSTRTGASDIGEYLQLELTGLASVGSESDKFLTTAIPGYVPEESPIRPKGP
jgi:LPS-assembly protein